MNALKPPPSLLCKLGSILVHFDEAASVTGNRFDVLAMRQNIDDPEVQEWMKEMGKMAMLPVKRNKEARSVNNGKGGY